MITTQNQQAQSDNKAPESTASPETTQLSPTQNSIKALILPPSLQMQQPIAIHHASAGLNPMVDAASYIFTVMGQLKTTEDFQHLPKLQEELLHEIDAFEQAVKQHHYNGEYIQVAKYVICAAFDELISNTSWGEKEWQPYSLLAAYGQDLNHQEKFYTILEHAVKEPAYYIDLMELMYICLSLGYTGHYQGNEHEHMQLDQITSSLYKYIRAYRGNISRLLSPAPIRAPRSAANNLPRASTSHWSILLFTACVITTLFIGLGYLMEMISNEAISNLSDLQKTVARNHLQSISS